MNYFIDKKDKREYLIGYMGECASCPIIQDSYEECTEHNCPNYEEYLEGHKIIFECNIGELLLNFIGIDYDKLEEVMLNYSDEKIAELYNMSMKELQKKEESNCKEEWFEWDYLKGKISLTESQFNLFLYFNKFKNYLYDGNLTKSAQMKEEKLKSKIHDMIKLEFVKIRSIKSYLNSCLIDSELYSDLIFMYFVKNCINFELEEIRPSDLYSIIFSYSDTKLRNLMEEDNFHQILKDSYNAQVLEDIEKLPQYDERYNSIEIEKLLVVSFLKIIEQGYTLKKCANCGLPFIPYNRSDTLYCDRISPQDNSRTCKEHGGKQAWLNNVRTDEAMKLYRNIYMQKQMLCKRNPDILEYRQSFDEFRQVTKQWKADIRKGNCSEREYINWLNDMKLRRQ